MGGAKCGQLRGRNIVHRRSMAETIVDKQGVLLTVPRDRKRAEMIERNPSSGPLVRATSITAQ